MYSLGTVSQLSLSYFGDIEPETGGRRHQRVIILTLTIGCGIIYLPLYADIQLEVARDTRALGLNRWRRCMLVEWENICFGQCNTLQHLYSAELCSLLYRLVEPAYLPT